ncbi:MAG TPA: SHOCT domain-containing protein [Tepidisphaeraceae bacterium]|jgi:uncharacterized membrane protein
MIPLAQSSDDAVRTIFVWLTVLIVLVVVLAAVIYFVRKRLSPNEDFRGVGFTLADLRQMHKSGQMSDEEFEKAKAQLLKGLQTQKTEEKPPKGA